MWVLGDEPKSSARTRDALNHRDTSPASKFCLFIFMVMCLYLHEFMCRSHIHTGACRGQREAPAKGAGNGLLKEQ